MANMSANIFSSMPFIPYKIVMALMENENFCKLIYYNTMDALSQPNLTIEQKQALIWDGDKDRMDHYNIFLTNIQPNSEIENRTIFKCYRTHTKPLNLVMATVAYRFDIIFGSKIPLVFCEGIPCNRGDVIEHEIMKSLNNIDVAGVGKLQYNAELTALCGTNIGVGNNYTFAGFSIVMATQISDLREMVCND